MVESDHSNYTHLASANHIAIVESPPLPLLSVKTVEIMPDFRDLKKPRFLASDSANDTTIIILFPINTSP